MTGSPEIPRPMETPVQQAPEGVQEIPTKMELPPDLERATGAQATSDDFIAQVTDDSGQQLIQTPQTTQATVTIPAAADDAMEDWKKEDPEESKTWWVAFWERFKKQALFFGKTVMKGEKSNA